MRVSCSFVYRDRLCSRFFLLSIRVSRHRGLILTFVSSSGFAIIIVWLCTVSLCLNEQPKLNL